LGIGDWGLGIGDWGLGIGPNPQSPNPQSPIPNPQLSIHFRLNYLIMSNYFFKLILFIFIPENMEKTI